MPPTGPEFLDEPSDDDIDGVVERRLRLPRWVPALAVVALLALATLVVAHGQRGVPRPQAIPSQLPFPTPTVRPVQLDMTLLTVYTVAHGAVPAHDIVRGGPNAGNCPGTAIGSTPQFTVLHRLLHALDPGYRALDSARLIDQNAGLCEVQARARNRAGVVAVLIVDVPSGGGREPYAQQAESDGVVHGDAVEYARFVSADGWQIIAGASGASPPLPSRDALAALVAASGLRW